MSKDMIAPIEQNAVQEVASQNPAEMSSVAQDGRFQVEEHERNPNTLGDAELIEVVQRVGRRIFSRFKDNFLEVAPHFRVLQTKYAKKGQRMPIAGNPHVVGVCRGYRNILRDLRKPDSLT